MRSLTGFDKTVFFYFYIFAETALVDNYETSYSMTSAVQQWVIHSSKIQNRYEETFTRASHSL